MSSSSVAPQAVCLQIIFYDLLSENATKRKIRLAPPHAISQWFILVRVEEGTAMMMAYTDHRGFSVAKFCSPLLGL